METYMAIFISQMWIISSVGMRANDFVLRSKLCLPNSRQNLNFKESESCNNNRLKMAYLCLDTILKIVKKSSSSKRVVFGLKSTISNKAKHTYFNPFIDVKKFKLSPRCMRHLVS